MKFPNSYKALNRGCSWWCTLGLVVFMVMISLPSPATALIYLALDMQILVNRSRFCRKKLQTKLLDDSSAVVLLNTQVRLSRTTKWDHIHCNYHFKIDHTLLWWSTNRPLDPATLQSILMRFCNYIFKHDHLVIYSSKISSHLRSPSLMHLQRSHRQTSLVNEMYNDDTNEIMTVDDDNIRWITNQVVISYGITCYPTTLIKRSVAYTIINM